MAGYVSLSQGHGYPGEYKVASGVTLESGMFVEYSGGEIVPITGERNTILRIHRATKLWGLPAVEAVVESVGSDKVFFVEQVPESYGITDYDEATEEVLENKHVRIKRLLPGEMIIVSIPSEEVDSFTAGKRLYPNTGGGVSDYAYIDIHGTKTWVDGDNAEDTRPAALVISIAANGNAMSPQPDVVWTKNDDNTWDYVFAGLPRKSSGTPIVYHVTETEPTGYDKTSDDHATANRNFTNTIEQAKITFKVTKTWEDDNNAGSTRPAKIKINLLQDGVKVDDVEMDGTETPTPWEHIFTNLDKYNLTTGHEHVYTATEDPVQDYETTQDGGDFTNTLIDASS